MVLVSALVVTFLISLALVLLPIFEDYETSILKLALSFILLTVSAFGFIISSTAKFPIKGFMLPTKEFVEKDNGDHIKFYLPIEDGKSKKIIIDYEKLKEFVNKNNKAVEEK